MNGIIQGRLPALAKVFCSTTLLLGLTINGAIAASGPPSAAHEQRATWIWGSTIRTSGAEVVAQSMKRDGITDAIMLVKGTAGTVAYLSAIAPRAASVDTLQEFIAACHKRGIRVHAWLNYHQDDYFGKTRTNYKYTIWHAGKPPAIPYAVNDGRICPLRAQEEYNAYFLSLVQEILSNYAVDGIHLDYIRYPHVVYCFCPTHQAQAANLGIDVSRLRTLLNTTLYTPGDQKSYYNAYASGDSDVTKWVGMRVSEIDGFLQSVKTALDQFNTAHNSSVALSAAVMPEGALSDLATDQARSDQFGLCHYAQKFEDMAPLTSFLAPMSYHKDYSQPASWVGKVAAGAMAKSAGKDVLAGIQEYTVTDKDIADALYAARWSQASGFATFRYGYSTSADAAFRASVPTPARLSASTQQFYTDGWITSANVNTALQMWLHNAEVALASGISGSARSNLQSYLGVLDAETGVHVDSRAAHSMSVNAQWLLDLIPPAIAMNLTTRSGALNERTWTFTFTNQGPGLGFDLKLNSLALVQKAGAACTPVVTTPLPLAIGKLAESSSAPAQVKLNFTGCPNNSRFQVTAGFSANDGVISGTKTIINQIP